MTYHPEAADVSITGAFTSPAWCLPQTMKQIMAYPLQTLQCKRCTSKSARKNKPNRRFLERLGFVVEGVQRRAYDGKQDIILYGVLLEELKWKK